MSKKPAAPTEELSQKSETLTADEIQEIAESFDEDQATALVPILKQAPAALANKIVDLLETMGTGQVGLEEMESGWSPPNVRVRQGMSKDVPKGVDMGELYTDDGEKLEKPFRFVPIYMHPGNMRFADDETGVSNCYSNDGKFNGQGEPCKECEDEPWKHGEATNCDRYRHAYAFDENFTKIFRISFGKTSYRTGGKLEKYMKAGKYPWIKVYEMGSKELDRKGGGTYFVATVIPTETKVIDPAHLDIGRLFYSQIRKVREAQKKAMQERKVEASDRAPKFIDKADGDIVAPGDAAEPDFAQGKSL